MRSLIVALLSTLVVAQATAAPALSPWLVDGPGLTRRATMTFDGLPPILYLGDTYSSLGVSWMGAYALTTSYPDPYTVGLPPGSGFFGAVAAYATLDTADGDPFVKEVRFSYATFGQYLAQIEAAGLAYQLPKVTAWSEKGGMGVPLGEVKLNWTRSAEVDYAFKEAVLPIKGAARSITWSPPLVQGVLLTSGVYFDDVVIVKPTEKGAALAAGAAAAERKVAEVGEGVQAFLAKVKAALPPLAPGGKPGE